MKYLLLGFLGLFVATAAVSLGFFYWKFRHSPAATWAARVRRRRMELEAQLLPPSRPTASQAKAAQLAEQLFATHLRSLPVDAVLGSPGIGPGTVERLENAGLRNFGQLVGYEFESLPGFGTVKAAEMANAVRRIWNEAKARFEAGACIEGREYQKLWAEMAAVDHAERAKRERTNAGIDAALLKLQSLEAIAADVTFWNLRFHKGKVPGLTEEVLNTPLPDIELAPEPIAVIPVLKPLVPEVRPELPLAAKPARDKPVAERTGYGSPIAMRPDASPASEHPQLPKLRAYAAFALVVAKADGRIAKSERAVVRELLASTFGHDATLVRFIDPLMEQFEKNVPAETEALAAIRAVTTTDDRRQLYTVAQRIADAAGECGAREVDALRRIAAAFDLGTGGTGISPVPYLVGTGILPVQQSSKLSPLVILEIDTAAPLSPELIRRRYSLLTEKADPAKAAAFGPEFAAMAERKRAEIRSAALELIAPFDVSLDPPAALPPPSDIRHNPDLDDVFGM